MPGHAPGVLLLGQRSRDSHRPAAQAGAWTQYPLGRRLPPASSASRSALPRRNP